MSITKSAVAMVVVLCWRMNRGEAGEVRVSHRRLRVSRWSNETAGYQPWTIQKREVVNSDAKSVMPRPKSRTAGSPLRPEPECVLFSGPRYCSGKKRHVVNGDMDFELSWGFAFPVLLLI
jgi:hypothetical protein